MKEKDETLRIKTTPRTEKNVPAERLAAEDAPEEEFAEPVFVDSSSGETLPLGHNIPEGGEVSEGDILRLVGEGRSKRHFRIDRIEYGDPPRVTVTEVGSNLKQVLLLLALLGVMWFVIKFILRMLH